MDPLTAPVETFDRVEVIRPAAVLESRVASLVLAALRADDVSAGGVWNASASVWQRYDRPWNGVGGTRGDARLMGTVAVMYDTPVRHEVTIYRVTITPAGASMGWSVNALCDDALHAGGLTLATCPRAEISNAPRRDPFKPDHRA
ncbi:MAG: hypothetical protein GC157_18150 [Frankiales bacterium]|nr:hypothetical protein [Frankiales bacterium]